MQSQLSAQSGRKDAKPSSLICLACIGTHSLEYSLETTPQAMHLIDQMQDDGDPFIIDAEVLTQITNELRARQIDVREHQLRLGLRWHEPAGFDPSLQHMVFNAGPNQKFLGGDHSNLQMPARILVLSRLPASCEFLEFRIELLRQYDLEGHVFVPVTLIATQRAL